MEQTISRTYSKRQDTKVTLEWRDGRNHTEAWNEICIWTIEQFGLPGDRFQWAPNASHMEFYFKDEQDAIHFMLRWS